MSLDLITGLLIIVLIADVSVIIFSEASDLMQIRGLVTTIVLTSNYITVGFCCIFGFRNTNWQFKIWENYLKHADGCFQRRDIHERLVKLAT